MALGSDLPTAELGAVRDLANNVQWVGWKLTIVDDKSKKVPVSPLTGRQAAVTNPTHWGTFEEAYNFAISSDGNGVGYVLSGLDGIVCIDLDKVLNPDNGEMEAWASDVVQAFDTYTEISPSGTGLHLWLRGKPPGDRCRTSGIEIYSKKRFITITGLWLGADDRYKHLVSSDEIEERQAALERLYDEAFVTKASGHFTPIDPEQRIPVKADPYGFPSPASGQWTLDEALFYVQRVMQDGKPPIPLVKFTACQGNDPRFNRIWKRTDAALRTSCGTDQSAWDLALCNRLLSYGEDFTWADILAILIAFREQTSTDKIDRPDYWARTISRASDSFTKRQITREETLVDDKMGRELKAISDQFNEAVKKGNEVERKGALQDLCERIECPEITRITRVKSERGLDTFTIYFLDQDAIQGDVSILTSQNKFRNIIASKLLRVIRAIKPAQWHSITQMLLTIVKDEEVTVDMSMSSQMVELVSSYLANVPRPVKFCRDTYLSDGPWFRKDELIMKLASFDSFLKKHHRVVLDRVDLARRLKSIGIQMVRVPYRTVGGKVTSHSVYVIPDDYNFHEIANRDMRHGTNSETDEEWEVQEEEVGS